MKKTTYIGFSTSLHDPAIAIVNSEGVVVFAEATERYLQNKRGWGATPDNMVHSIELLEAYCADTDKLVLATSWSKFAARNNRYLLPFIAALKKRSLISIPLDPGALRWVARGMTGQEFSSGENLTFLFSSMMLKSDVVRKSYDHHLTHAIYGCHSSPFEEAVCAVVDGFGERSSVGFFHYRNGKVEPLRDPTPKPSQASLGTFYMALCVACGFNPLMGEEWKVMGLAAHGKRDNKLYDLLRKSIGVTDCSLVRPKSKLSEYDQHLSDMGFTEKPSDNPLEKADLAHAGQLVFCDVMAELLNNLHKRGLSQNLVLTGGAALNSACNGQLLDLTDFKALHVPSAPGDDGNALGAALIAYQDDHPEKKSFPSARSPYLGSTISSSALERTKALSKLEFEPTKTQDLCQRVAQLIAQGKIIGWVQGKAEFGPRALGNRSILADPRNPKIKDIINSRVKFREEFRPFAPAILHEYGPEYFDGYVETPCMERALPFKEGRQETVPGVVHTDGTGRLQSVTQQTNPLFYQLIDAFRNLTGVPILLNTSFNVMGKPIMHSVEDAFALLCTTGLDYVVIDDVIFSLPSVTTLGQVSQRGRKLNKHRRPLHSRADHSEGAGSSTSIGDHPTPGAFRDELVDVDTERQNTASNREKQG